jgi:TPP-dependent 2-oxoacid decarboxylase
MSTDLITKEIRPIAKQAQDVSITDNASMAGAVSLLSDLNRALTKVTEEKEKVTKPLNEALKAERNRWKPIETELTDAINNVREKMSVYQTEETKRARAAEEKIASRIAPGKGNLSVETAVKKIDAIERPEDAIATDAGLVKFRTIQTLLITDEKLIPRHYLVVDEKKLLDDLKKGVKVFGATLEEKQIPVNFR